MFLTIKLCTHAKLIYFEIELTICLKMDLALNKLSRLICLKPNQPTTQSSSSCRAASTDIPDPLSPLLPIIHRLRQVFRITSCVLT